MAVADKIYNSMLTRRLITLTRYNKKLFGSATAATSTYKPEFVRKRICKEWICEFIENLTLSHQNVLNVLFEICAITLPPFFASSFPVYTVSKGLGGGAKIHLEYTIIFAVLFALCLHVLYQGVKTLEDLSIFNNTFEPTAFIGIIALDRIHVHEELKVLYCRHVVNACNLVFSGSPTLNVDLIFISCTKEVIISKNYILHCKKERAKHEKEMTNRKRDKEEDVGE
ncbi:hypothetical protein ACHAW5_008154 [Stephanodiscus triporus]|uniref:Uncharacterized protein n=1 Tax=Stephanodiscus triporus TaxID=2934178 RepID=A0ABD3NB16_9STRA